MYRKTRQKIEAFSNGVRWLFALPLLLVTTLIVTAGIAVSTVSFLLSDADTLKFWIAKSGVYTEGLDVAFDITIARQREAYDRSEAEMQGERPPFDEVLAQSPLPPEEAKRAAKEVLTPVYLQEQTEGVIDAFYAYARREADTFDVAIDVGRLQEPARGAMTTIFTARVASLPLCGDTSAVPLGEAALFSEEACLPPGTDLDAVNQAISAEIEKLTVLERDTITLQDFPVEHTEVLSRVPFLFGFLRAAPAIIALLLLLLTLLLLLLVPHRKSRGAVVGFAYGLPAALAFGLSVSLRKNAPELFQQFVYTEISDSSSQLAALATRLASAAAEDVSRMLALVSGATILFAIFAVLVALRRPIGSGSEGTNIDNREEQLENTPSSITEEDDETSGPRESVQG